MRRRDHGLTLIELMVTLVLALVVVLAAVTALLATRRGFQGVDAVGQLQDNTRFAVDLVQRIAAQSGYLADDHAVQTRRVVLALAGAPSSPSDVQGYDDALGPAGANGSRASGCTASAGASCRQGGDVLVLRTQAAARAPGTGETDHATLDCMGDTVKTPPADRIDRSVSVFYVAVGSDAEPSLMCAAGTMGASGTTLDPPQPAVQGVESLQVLYGVDGVQPNARTPAATPVDGVAERYLRADQLVVAGDDAATRENWSRVRSLRIGMVLRGPPGAVQDRSSTPTLYPLGEAMSSADDPGTRFVPEADGRLRRTAALTVHLRNRQALP